MPGEPSPREWLPPRAPTAFPPPSAMVARDSRQPVSGAPGRRRAPASALSTWSLILGIAGLALLVLTLGVGAPLTLPCSAAAWACATVDRRRAQALDPDRPLPARAGRMLGIAGVVLGLLALVLWTAVVAGGTSLEETLESWRNELEREQQQRSLGL